VFDIFDRRFHVVRICTVHCHVAFTRFCDTSGTFCCHVTVWHLCCHGIYCLICRLWYRVAFSEQRSHVTMYIARTTEAILAWTFEFCEFGCARITSFSQRSAERLSIKKFVPNTAEPRHTGLIPCFQVACRVFKLKIYNISVDDLKGHYDLVNG
jgi:hypothetical protein